jgi:hypothetical protein
MVYLLLIIISFGLVYLASRYVVKEIDKDEVVKISDDPNSVLNITFNKFGKTERLFELLREYHKIHGPGSDGILEKANDELKGMLVEFVMFKSELSVEDSNKFDQELESLNRNYKLEKLLKTHK